MAAPLLSVVLPAYNAEAYLHSALQSVLRQTFADFELIVIDDGSKDRTADILGDINDRRLRVISHERNVGLVGGLNEGIETARGKYIARMDADDVCEPSRFLSQIEWLERHPEVGVLGTAVRVIDEQDRPSTTYVMPVTSIDVEWAMPLLCPVAHPSVMMRAELVKRAGGYSTRALHAEDYDLWHRLAAVTKLANLPAPLLRLRKHTASVTSTQRLDHMDAATAVAKAVVDRRLDDDIPASIIRCLRSWGEIDGECAIAAVVVLQRLVGKFNASHDRSLTAQARRDASMRIAYMARRLRSNGERAWVLREAHRIYPLVLPAIVQKAGRRVIRGATRKLIG